MAAAPQQGGQSDNSMGFVWTIAALLVFGFLIWSSFKAEIITFYFQIKLWEISVISLFTSHLDGVRDFIQTTDPRQLTLNDMIAVGEKVGGYLSIPLMLVIVLLACLIYLSNSTRSFKRTYDMYALANAEKINWPQISSTLPLKLVQADIDKGAWAMAMTPMQFCKRHRLLDEYRAPLREGMLKKDRNRIEVVLRRGQANRLFALQLGATWRGVNALPPYAYALFAAFAARNAGDTKGAAALLTEINVSSSGKLNFSGAAALCKKHINTKMVQQVMKSHAYMLTVMASMLEIAREDGVQASADFLWLKPVDRRLWYMLNTVGRQTPFVEVAGVFAHWVAEKDIGRALMIPMIETATNALELALKDVVYRSEGAD